MRQFRHVFKRIRRPVVVAAGLLVVFLLGVFGYLALALYYGPVPDTSGSQRIAGLTQDVTVYRDSWGVPHIFANTVEDLFFAQGFTHAQDRWWQMELTRKLGRGELSQILDNNDLILDADRLVYTLGLLQSAERDWDSAPVETRRVLNAYSAGVNAYIAERNTDDLAVEYGLLALSGELDSLFAVLGQDVPVEPWTPVDSILWGKLLAWQMSGNWWQELENARLYRILEEPLLSAYLYPQAPPSSLSILSGISYLEDIFPNMAESLPPVPPEIDFKENIAALEAPLVEQASTELLSLLGLNVMLRGNAWVVGGQHSTTGAPILANDLQGAPTIPGQWFEIGLHCRQPSIECPYDVVGFSAAGVPGIFVGHNDQIAWGINILNADVQDLYLLKLDPEDPTRYLWDGNWREMKQRTVTVAIGENADYSFTVFATHLGPVLTDIEAIRGQTSLFNEPYQAIALHWPTIIQNNDLVGTLLTINRAQNWTSFQTALDAWQWPALTFVYADQEGNIGYRIAGQFPVRNASHSGYLPVPGWTSEYEWQAVVPNEFLPSVYNPLDAKIVDANQIAVPWWYNRWLSENLGGYISVGGTWSPGFRAERLSHLLNRRRRHSPDDIARMQGDPHNQFADLLLPYLAALDLDESMDEAVNWLLSWDRTNTVDSPQAVWFEMIWVEIVRETFTDQLGWTPAAGEYQMRVITPLLQDADHPWWDNIETPFTQETRDDILLRALVRSYSELHSHLDDDRESWRWGDLHHVTLRSRIIGQEGLMSLGNVTGLSINRGRYPLSGGLATLNTTFYDIVSSQFDTSQGIILAPTYRMIIDLSDFSNSRAIQATGQSGHPASDNYDDMIAPWRAGEYHNMRWGGEIVDRAKKQLDLRPAPTYTPGHADDEAARRAQEG